MMAILPAIIGAGAAIGAGLIAGKGQRDVNVQNLKIAREQMAFQERMSGSAYQRAVADMKLAGINPMLAYQQGGASSPSGQTARMESITAPAVSSAMQSLRLKQEIDLYKQQIRKTSAEADDATWRARNTSLQHQFMSGTVPSGTPGRSEYVGRAMLREQLKMLRTQVQREIFGLPAARLSGSTAGGVIKLGAPMLRWIPGLSGAGKRIPARFERYPWRRK